MANKIELMHRIFGKNEKYCCIECSHYKRKTYGSRTYRKCEVYGDGNSTGGPIVELAGANKRTKDDDIPGQMRMFV